MNENGEPSVRIVPVEGGRELLRVRELFLEYATTLGFDLDFQGFDGELAALPGGYARPRGRLRLAIAGGEAAGCVAVREIDTEVRVRAA